MDAIKQTTEMSHRILRKNSVRRGFGSNFDPPNLAWLPDWFWETQAHRVDHPLIREDRLSQYLIF